MKIQTLLEKKKIQDKAFICFKKKKTKLAKRKL